MGIDQAITTKISTWGRVKTHFTEAFSDELLSPGDYADYEGGDEWHDNRRRNAYRYILVVLTAVVIPVFVYNLYLGEPLTAGGTLGLLVVLVGNIAMLTSGRQAPVSLKVVLMFSIAMVMLAFYLGQDFALFLLYPLLVALPVLLPARWAAGFTIVSVIVVAPLVLEIFDSMTAFIIALSLGLTWLVAAWLLFAVSEQAKRLRGMAITDPLTGAYNRRYLELRATKSLENWERYGRCESLLIFDIDHFKRINDKFGHQVGDQALKALVEIVKRRVRKVDTLFRFGGEEFVLLLSESTAAQAERVADELREVIESSSILPQGNMTISVGVCDASQADSVDHWLKLADAALYLAKRNGRNCVEVATTRPLNVVPIAKTVPDWR